MNFAAHSGRAVLLALAFLVSGRGQGAELPGGFKHLVFAIAYRAVDAAGAGGQYVVLGHYDFSADGDLNLTYFFYDAARNRKGSATPHRHPRLSGGPAPPGPIHIPAYTLAEQVRGTWSYDAGAGVLRARVGTSVHDWRLRDRGTGLFVPADAYTNADDGSHSISGWTYSDARGYAYLTNHSTLPRKVTRDDLLPTYHGEIQSLITPRGGVSHWTQKRSDLNLGRYKSGPDPDVLGYQYASRWSNTATQVFSTLLLNYAPHSKLLLYHAGGHDFNRNGVFDEPGHTMQMFGIHDGSKIARIVYVEHSYQTAGQPILSVGHYFAP